MIVSGRTALLALLAAGLLGFLFALALSPGAPRPSAVPVSTNVATVVITQSENGE